MTSESPFDDEKGQSPEDCWETLQVLREGDTVLINHREQPLTIREIIRRGEDDTVKRVVLLGNEAGYTITATKNPNTPIITWPSAEHSRPVQKIRAAGSTILSTVRVTDVLQQVKSQADCVDTGEQTSFNYEICLTQILGSCPDCDSIVVSDRSRAVCQGCREWCWVEQWESF